MSLRNRRRNKKIDSDTETLFLVKMSRKETKSTTTQSPQQKKLDKKYTFDQNNPSRDKFMPSISLADRNNKTNELTKIKI